MSSLIKNIVLECDADAIQVTIRPITQSDKAIETEFIERLSVQTKHDRFLGGVNSLSEEDIEKLCDVNEHGSMAYVAIVSEQGKQREVGVARYIQNRMGLGHEMALTIADDFKQTKLPTILMDTLIEHAKREGIQQLYSVEFRTNKSMRELAHHYNMRKVSVPGMAPEIQYVIDLLKAPSCA